MMSYLDFLHAAQATDDAKEAARKLAEWNASIEESRRRIEADYPPDEQPADVFKRGPGRPKKVSVTNPANQATVSEAASQKAGYPTPASEISSEVDE